MFMWAGIALLMKWPSEALHKLSRTSALLGLASLVLSRSFNDAGEFILLNFFISVMQNLENRKIT